MNLKVNGCQVIHMVYARVEAHVLSLPPWDACVRGLKIELGSISGNPKLVSLWIEHLMLRATSHTSPKAHDHCNLRVLISQKGGDHPSLLRTRR